MRTKSLYSLVRNLLIGSCALLPLTSQANETLYQRYWQSVSDNFRMPVSQYRFRPSAVGDRQSAMYRPQRFSFNRVWQQPSQRYAYRPIQQPQLMAFNSSQYKAPAFARQFHWAPAPATVFRKGQSQNFYASENNNSVESSYAPGYRSEPVNAQGYRFRSSQRSAPFVSFADRVRDAGSQQQINSYQQSNFAANAYRAPTNATINTSPAPVPVLHQPVMSEPAYQPAFAVRPPLPEVVAPVVPKLVPQAEPVAEKLPVKVFMSSQPLPTADGYDFRPDERFAPSVKPAFSAPKAQPLRPAKPAQAPVVVDNLQLARAQFAEGSANPWNNWSFRPMDSALQR